MYDHPVIAEVEKLFSTCKLPSGDTVKYRWDAVDITRSWRSGDGIERNIHVWWDAGNLTIEAAAWKDSAGIRSYTFRYFGSVTIGEPKEVRGKLKKKIIAALNAVSALSENDLDKSSPLPTR